MNSNISAKDIEKAREKINILRQDINDLGRIIKILEAIANAIKKFNNLKHHSFSSFFGSTVILTSSVDIYFFR